MMSLTKVSLPEMVKQQYAYKLKAYIQVFMSLVMIQVIAVLFSLGGTGMMGSGGGLIDLELHYYSADVVVAFTILWGFITAVLITTKAYRNDDFLFVTNRITSNFSNMLFLLTASIIGGVTAVLSTFLVKIMISLLKKDLYISGPADLASITDMLSGIFASILYIFLFCALGYLVGTLVQLNRLFAFVLPVVFIGGVFLDGMRGEGAIIQGLYRFFFTEPSIALFSIKVICTLALLFTGAFVLSNRMEVKSS
ncbi:hypothetical protein [Neobacillus mesonae]|uniref:hypothetical protein n=1 Tax=Neobacillus mesonae TaxID=1193713 RepID=UPI00203DA9D7|nr:hypothetical protein [Neobacillus mesonae]MCM3568583.1 hypothetical protein [Neobacillus mesonae]